MSEFVHVATVTAAHGVSGQFKLFCLLESPENLVNFKDFFDASGALLPLKIVNVKSKQPIASMPHITDKNTADALKQKKIFVRQSDFPPIEENLFYSYQLAGLKVMSEKGEAIGVVRAHHNFGAGDVLEIQFPDGTTELYPFKNEFFPEINIDAGTISFIPPIYL